MHRVVVKDDQLAVLVVLELAADFLVVAVEARFVEALDTLCPTHVVAVLDSTLEQRAIHLVDDAVLLRLSESLRRSDFAD